MRNRSYKELSRLETFEERFRYLELGGLPGHETFGFDRYLNQAFYKSRLWRNVRDEVITRDLGCDLGIPGYEIHSGLYIHHMNPMRSEEIISGSEDIIDPEFLITTSHVTHNAIHYGNHERVPRQVVERRPNDTKLW